MTGLLTGGLTCLAVQGGLLAATIAQREEEHLKETAKKGSALPILTFLIAKIIAYTILGFLLGWFGSLFQPSLVAKAIMQFAIVIFMIGTALALLDVHPVFRYFIIQPPKKLMRLVRSKSKSGDMFAPAFLGALTVFIPCGTTQAMMALAIGFGSPVYGASIMLAFTLGTSPLFFILGYFATRLGEFWHKKFLKVAAVGIIVLALYTFNGALALAGSTWSFSNIIINTKRIVSGEKLFTETLHDGVSQEWTITIEPNGYSPRALSVPAGKPITIHLRNDKGYSCAQAFTIPRFGIERLVAPGSTDIVRFTAPDTPQKIVFTCSMGMYSGIINVL